MKTKVETVVFVIKDEKILLAEKKTDNNVVAVEMVGKLNGYGGVCKINETFEESAIREFNEEAEPAKIVKKFLRKVGEIDFIFLGDKKSKVNLHIFLSDNIIGVPKEGREMKKGEWFSTESLPKDRMIATDLIWLPRILNGEVIEGEIFFNNEKELVASNIERVEGL